MAINVSQAFHRTSANAVDDTLTLTKAEMLAVNDNLMPSKYLTVCQDDGFIYLYDKTATPNQTTGKFTKFEGGGGGGSSTFAELTDVDLNDLADGQTIAWDATNSKWVNTTPSSGGGTGSIFKIVARRSALFNTNVTVSQNGQTVVGTIDSEGKCELIVPFIGDMSVIYSDGGIVSVHVDYYTLINVDPGVPDTPNVSYEIAYGLANELVSNSQNYLAGSVLHTKTNGYNTWYSTSSNIADLGWDTMISDYSSGSHTIANGDITFTNTGNDTSFTCNKTGAVVMSYGSGAKMSDMRSNGNVFSFKNVQSGDVIQMQDSTNRECFITFYPIV